MTTTATAARTPSTAIRWLGLLGWVAVTGLTLQLILRGGLTADAAPVPLLLLIAFVAFIAPDLTFLAGAGQPTRHGYLPTRAVPSYNAMHVIWGPLLLAAVAAVAARWEPVGSVLLVAALSWAAHVLLDRAAGYGLRRPDGGR